MVDICLSLDAHVLTFLSRLLPASDLQLDEILGPSILFERQLRELYANDPKGDAVQNPYTGLLSVFDINNYSETMKARPRTFFDEENRKEQIIFPIPVEKRNSLGDPVTVEHYSDFVHQWEIFSEGSLAEIDWSNIVVAGGSVLACVSPVPQEFRTSKRSLRDYFQKKEYLSSDIDIFLWGLSPIEVCGIVHNTPFLT